MSQTPPTPRPWRWTSPAWAVVAVALTTLIFRCYQEDQRESGTWGCEMSYMWPTYHQVEWADNPSGKYSLWLYREQGWDRDLRPNGHPVVFIPGNAGSFKQVRSIASSAARQYYTESGGVATGMEKKSSVDFFAVDYNEDFSAFHAATLREQATFLGQSVRHALSQYSHLPSKRQPKKVTLLGHSMGGIAARLATEELAGLVDAIITMSTPHVLPPVTLERDMDIIWTTLDSQVYNASSPLLVSICGGTADTQITSDACVIPQSSVTAENGFTIFTTGMPGAWTSVEHQAMVWCHQIRWRVARALLDMTAQQERAAKLGVAEQWFLGTASARPALRHEQDRRIPVTAKSMSLRFDAPDYDPLSSMQWCKSDNECLEINAVTTLLPAPANPDAPFPLPGEGVRTTEQAFIVDVEVPEVAGWVELPRNAGQVTVGTFKQFKTQSSTWRGQSETASHFSINFASAAMSSLLVHRLDLETPDCQGLRPTIRSSAHLPAIRNNVHESRYFPHAGQTIHIHSHVASAPFVSGSRPSGIVVDIYQDSSCRVTEARMSVAWGASLAKIVTRYRMAAVAWTIGWLAVAFSISTAIGQETSILVPPSDALHFTAGRPFLGMSATILASNLIAAHGTFLDISGLEGIPFTAAMLIWSFATLHLVWVLVMSLLRLPALCLGNKRYNAPTSTPSLWSTAATAVPCLLAVHFLIPHQMAFIILLLVMLAATATEDPNSPRFSVMSMVTLLLVTLFPFNAPVLAVWGRNIWTDHRNPFPGDYDAIRILPLLSLVCLGVSGRSPKPRKRLLGAIRYTFMLLAAVAFILGPRRTWLIPYIANVVYIEMALLLV